MRIQLQEGEWYILDGILHQVGVLKKDSLNLERHNLTGEISHIVINQKDTSYASIVPIEDIQKYLSGVRDHILGIEKTIAQTSPRFKKPVQRRIDAMEPGYSEMD